MAAGCPAAGGTTQPLALRHTLQEIPECYHKWLETLRCETVAFFMGSVLVSFGSYFVDDLSEGWNLTHNEFIWSLGVDGYANFA